MLLSQQTQKSGPLRERSAPWTEATAAGALPARPPRALAGGSVNKTARLPAGPAQPVKGKEIRDFPSRLLRLLFWRRQLLGYARAGLPKAPGHFRPGPGSSGRSPAKGCRTVTGRPTEIATGGPLGTSGPCGAPLSSEVGGGGSGVGRTASGSRPRAQLAGSGDACEG